MTSSINPLALTTATPTILANTDILTSDIAITDAMVKPGGGGILRLYFSFTFGVSPATVNVFNGTLKGALNADNSSQVVDNGYYRFDIDVESGDPADEILMCAKKHEADIIVVGYKGYGKEGRFLLGSVTDKVVRHAGVSVLVVR